MVVVSRNSSKTACLLVLYLFLGLPGRSWPWEVCNVLFTDKTLSPGGTASTSGTFETLGDYQSFCYDLCPVTVRPSMGISASSKYLNTFVEYCKTRTPHLHTFQVIYFGIGRKKGFKKGTEVQASPSPVKFTQFKRVWKRGRNRK